MELDSCPSVPQPKFDKYYRKMQGIGLSIDYSDYTRLGCYNEEADVIDFINNMDYVIGDQDMILWLYDVNQSKSLILFEGVEICGDGDKCPYPIDPENIFYVTKTADIPTKSATSAAISNG